MRTILLVLATLAVASAERLKLEYFHDSAGRAFTASDFAFADAERGMAVGILRDGGRTRAAALVTTDAGRTWNEARLPAPGLWVSLYQHSGWFGDGQRVWRTEDFGKTWKRDGKLKDIVRVHFLNNSRGWALGANKQVLETSDGGRTWTRVPAAAQPKTAEETSLYRCISFADDRHGMIAGSARRRDRRRYWVPDWAEPEMRPRELPGVTMILTTVNGGKTWSAAQASMFGQVTELKLTPEARGLSLIEFVDEFPYPSEIYRLDLTTGNSIRSFRAENRAVTDIEMLGGTGWAVAVEPPGKMLRSPIPGKLHLLKTKDLNTWTEVPVDYRAEASRATFAVAGGKLWVATDTGMLLSLSED